jgi:alpha-tubulin suppressor-like RCC1 family protein
VTSERKGRLVRGAAGAGARARPGGGPATVWLGVLVLTAAGSGCDAVLGPGVPVSFSTVEAGGSHTCGLVPNGDIYCWGQGSTGELGDGRVQTSAEPVRVAATIALGLRHTCATDEAGAAYCWGWNAGGQLGMGGTVGLGIANPVEGGLAFSRLTGGFFHTCGLTTAGGAYCWGGNGQGQLGIQGQPLSAVPVPVTGDLRFTDISAGAYHTCAVATDGQAYCWGLNFIGQLGVGDTRGRMEPTPVVGGLRFRRVTAGFTHSCGITTDDRAYCWGSSAHGELGNGTILPEGLFGSPEPNPVHEPGGHLRFTTLSAGRHFTCGTDPGRGVWCWGSGQQGQLGINQLADWAVPRSVIRTFDLRFTTVSAGLGTHVCGATAELAVYCWGTSQEGALGPSGAVATLPVRVYRAR